MRPWIAAVFCLAGCGARSELALPEVNSGPLKVTSLALGDNHSCALLSDGTAACWGDDDAGELGGVGTALGHTTPIPLQGATGIVQIACGNGMTCVVLGDGTLECWGGEAMPVVIGTGFTMASIGIACSVVPCSNGNQACGVLVDGSVTCDEGPGGLVPVSGLQDAVSIGIGSTLACALRTGGNVSCWGTGPLGDGTSNGSTMPVDVVDLGGHVKQLAVGDVHACALLEDGSVACWGSFTGALGVAPPHNSGLTPAVVGLPPAKRISSYSYQACAVLADGTVSHWGTNYDPDDVGSLTPKAVPGLSSVVDVASGQYHNCALLANGRVECWGLNYDGELGDGTKTTSETPVRVIGLP
jgi:alpha-tubulin suppressor-like RCC1 family protein